MGFDERQLASKWKKIGQRTFWSPKKLLEDNQLKRREKKKEKKKKKDPLKVKIQNTRNALSWKSTLAVFYKSPKTPHDWVFWKDPGHQDREANSFHLELARIDKLPSSHLSRIILTKYQRVPRVASLTSKLLVTQARKGG